MISIKSEREIILMREAGKRLADTFKKVEEVIKPGMTTNELDKIIHDYITSIECIPTCLGFEGFPKSACISVNDEVVHGIPGKRIIKDGDIVSVDLVLTYKGYCADAARTYIIGSVSDEVKSLVEDTKGAFYAGANMVHDDARICEISKAVEKYAHSHGLSVVEELVGHGIGTDMHEDPEVPNFNTNDRTRLKAGMTICIEPMLNLGNKEVTFEDDGWTVKTKDGSMSAHYENTILITENEPQILTMK